MNENEIRIKIKNFINDNFFYIRNKTEFSDSSSFLEFGIIDSTGIIEFIIFIKEEFNCAVEDDEMLPENLDSINNIVAFVKRKCD